MSPWTALLTLVITLAEALRLLATGVAREAALAIDSAESLRASADAWMASSFWTLAIRLALVAMTGSPDAPTLAWTVSTACF